jgi:hypothetical protein
MMADIHRIHAVPTGTEAAVCQMIAARQQLGIAKYGQTVADNPIDQRAWLQHALEETLDQAVYLKRAIDEIDRRSDANERARQGLQGQAAGVARSK